MPYEDLDLALSICAMQRALSRALNNEDGSEKACWTEYCFLKAVHESPGIGVQQLASKACLSSGSATYTLDRLEAKGLLVRNKKLSDSRSSLVLLTESGEKLQTELADRLKAVSSDLFQGIIIEKKSCALEVIHKAIQEAKASGHGGAKVCSVSKRER